MDESTRQNLQECLGDSHLLSLEWQDNDLRMVFRHSGNQPQEMKFRFIWVTELSVELEFDQYSGPSLVFGVSVAASGVGWIVRVDFGVAPEGFIEFKCNGCTRE